MKFTWQQRTGSARLLLFFHGWSMDDTVFTADGGDGADILICFDYTDRKSAPDWRELGRRYGAIDLAAWSLGVWAAAAMLAGSGLNFRRSVAINGSLRPLNADFGIAPAIFNGTAEHWHEETARRNFYRRTGCGMAIPRRSWEEQQRELRMLAAAIAGSAMPENCFRTAVIGGRDRIFGAGNLRRFWDMQDGVRIRELPELPHWPFAGCRRFNELPELAE